MGEGGRVQQGMAARVSSARQFGSIVLRTFFSRKLGRHRQYGMYQRHVGKVPVIGREREVGHESGLVEQRVRYEVLAEVDFAELEE